MLNIVNKSPFERSSFEACLNHATDGSSVLLIEDGVYGALKGAASAERVKAAQGKVKFFALKPDLEARGVHDRVLDGVILVDYAGFVDLVTQNAKVHSWL